MKKSVWMFAAAAFVTTLVSSAAAKAQSNGCSLLPNYSQLKAALNAAKAAENSGLNAPQWGTIVDRDGIVCAVAFMGNDRNSQFGFARISSAMRANTASSFNTGGGAALSTANLYSSTEPGGFVGLLPLNYPVNESAVFGRHVDRLGTPYDPLIGQRVGGFVALGGGVGLYGPGGVALGGLGVAGDHSCTDHDIAWRVRNLLGLDHLAGFPPVSGDPSRPDNIVYDITPNPNGGTGNSASGLGHPGCPNQGDPKKLPAVTAK
jgi:hypothetical protein